MKAKEKFYLISKYLIAMVTILLINNSAVNGQVLTDNRSSIYNKADAINLIIEKNYHVNSNGSYTLKLHLKSLIKTYRGKKEWADFRIPYNSTYETVKIIEAQTITKAGKKLKVTTREIHDISDPATQNAAVFSASRIKVVSFPRVEEGSIIELTLTKSSSLGFWGEEAFSLSNPTKLKRVIIDLPENLKLRYHLADKHIDFKKTVHNHRILLTWEGRDLDKLPDDPLMPSILNLDSTLCFSSLTSWMDVSSLLKRLLTPPHKEEDGNNLPMIAKDIPIQNPEELYVRLQQGFDIFPIPLFLSSLKVQAPYQTLSRRYGSQMDFILLFKALLEEAGLKDLHIAAVNSRGIWLKDLKDVYNPGLFDTFVLRVKNQFFSFDHRDLPPGITGMDGQLALDLDTGNFITIKDKMVNSIHHTFRYHVTTPTSLTADYTGKYQGASSVSIKESFRYLSPQERQVQDSTFFHSLNPLAEPLKKLEIKGLDDQSQTVTLSARYRVDSLGAENNNIYLLPVTFPGVLEMFATFPLDRHSPLFIRHSQHIYLDISFNMAEYLSVLGLPQDTSGQIGPFSWVSNCQRGGNGEVTCHRQVELKRGFIRDTKEFTRFKKVIAELISPGQTSIRFKLNYSKPSP